MTSSYYEGHFIQNRTIDLNLVRKPFEIVFITLQLVPVNNPVDHRYIDTDHSVSKTKLVNDSSIWILCVTCENIIL
jgi:hypothetical protein